MSEGLIWSFVLSFLGIAGIILAGSKYKVGWLIGFFVQPLWIIFAITTEQYGFILNALIYATVYARNWLKWRREERALSHPGTPQTALNGRWCNLRHYPVDRPEP
jgi:hypothetical protein